MNTTNETLVPTIETETETAHILTRKEFNRYRGKLRLLSQIHNEIADTLNEMREQSDKICSTTQVRIIKETKQNDYTSLFFHRQSAGTSIANTE